ncbi:2Fe-2S iron-sulfur cluster-binding protein, partial [Helicobacter sp. MIT 14-3879]|uniref:2Fe-2S iron-sulfur cluster-binding protein n=1 Tax=Helicobacter sp. MIT 14-3879 TaxID=2040649 RepID=UPI000E1E4E28
MSEIKKHDELENQKSIKNPHHYFDIFIDDKQCTMKKGQSILQVARENGIYIPTLCDLSKLSPTGACRMCVVEEENGNIIASCKSYPNFSTKPAKFRTNTQRLEKYRNQIMSFLCINHPLECGVCDKSGECELQDKVLESKVDIQPYFALQKQQDFVHFHNKIYDESLCIMCERCARTCNEFVGNNVLNVLAGGFHSKIGVDFNAYCEDCDECVSVCPTGAMISQRFTYTSNVWELEKVPSTCVHCSLRCELYYEIKCNVDSKKEVYRIKNEAHIKQLCHAGRHNFMRKNPFYRVIESVYNNLADMDSVQQSLSSNGRFYSKHNDMESQAKYLHFRHLNIDFSKIQAIRLSENATNEEAWLVNQLAQKMSLKVYCDSTFYYDRFGSIIYHANERVLSIDKALESADVCVVLGAYLYDEMPVLRSDLSKYNLKRGMKNIWINTIGESRFKSDLELRYETGAEFAISAILLNLFMPNIIQENISQKIASLSDLALDSQTKEYLKAWLKNLDMGHLIAESNISESELERLQEILLFEKPIDIGHSKETTEPLQNVQAIKRNNIVFLVGQDFTHSPDSIHIAQIFKAINALANVSVLPLAYGNVIGINALCNISRDDNALHGVVGIRAQGEYEIAPLPSLAFLRQGMDSSKDLESPQRLDSLFSKFFPILPLQFMEGTVFNLYDRLVKITPSFVDDDFGSFTMLQKLKLSPNSPFNRCNTQMSASKSYPSNALHSLFSSTEVLSLDLLDICREFLDLEQEFIVEITNLLPFYQEANHVQKGNGDYSLNFMPFHKFKQSDFIDNPPNLPSNIACGEGSGISIYNASLSGNLSFYDFYNTESCYEIFNQAMWHNKILIKDSID